MLLPECDVDACMMYKKYTDSLPNTLKSIDSFLLNCVNCCREIRQEMIVKRIIIMGKTLNQSF